MTERPKHRASVKIALFNESRDHILMTVLPDGRYGLPGGHVEEVEQLDAALERELEEELGLKPDDYSVPAQYCFWKDPKGSRIILAYTGILHASAIITVDPTEVVATVWVSREDIEAGKPHSKTYDTFLQECCRDV